MPLNLEFSAAPPKYSIELVAIGQDIKCLSQPQTTTISAANFLRGPAGPPGGPITEEEKLSLLDAFEGALI